MNSEIIGQLGVVDEMDYPRIIPVNFTEFDGNIFFHGAQEGEKYNLYLKKPKVTFSVYKPYSYIPSYYMSEQACTATIFFKSVHIRGKGLMNDNLEEKKLLL